MTDVALSSPQHNAIYTGLQSFETETDTEHIPQGELKKRNSVLDSSVLNNDSFHGGSSKHSVTAPKFTMFANQANQRTLAELNARAEANKAYIRALEAILMEHNIPIPEPPVPRSGKISSKKGETEIGLLKDGNITQYEALLHKVSEYHRHFHLGISYQDIGYWTMAPKPSIPTVGNSLRKLFLGSGPKHRVDILKGITGRILPGRMTLILGPPGSGKSSLLKVLCGRLRPVGGAKIDGVLLYNGERLPSEKFLIQKVTDYIEQEDRHAATLTVYETVMYAWMSTSGGHHSYAVAKDEKSAEILDREDKTFSRLNNMLTILGLSGVKNTYVGDGTVRGISGGQKRRVTCAEMAICPRPAKFFDSITNGLDSATAFDIVLASKRVCHILGTTSVMSLLQPPPEVYDLFDEIMLLSEGQIIFHGSREDVLPYFESIGYFCPDIMDEADFLQELPKREGHRFIKATSTMTHAQAPRGTTALVNAWKSSALYKKMLDEMTVTADDTKTLENVESGKAYTPTATFPPDFKEMFPNSLFQMFKLALDRQITLTKRDSTFLKARIGQSIIVSAIAGSLFSNIATSDYTTMNGFLFFSVLNGALSSFSMMPLVYAQKSVFYKQSEALFLNTLGFTSSQGLVLVPLHMVETIIFGTIMYWSAGLSDDGNGSRFLTFLLICFTFSVVNGQFFRLIAFIMPNIESAGPMAGINIVLQVLFSGFIQPRSQISNGWIWFYWLNPTAYALKAITVNQFKSSQYDNYVPTISGSSQRFGDLILDQYGNPTDERWIWYCFGLLIAFYIVFFILSTLALKYLRQETAPPAPIIIPDEEAVLDIEDVKGELKDLPFESIAFAFKDICYSVQLPGGEELDLLRNVTGFFEPGTMTALMGSSGAGKTTLLDVLSGRKNTGIVKGNTYLNGVLKDEHHFRKVTGYVEQFDSLSPHDTAREAIEFSAALRLSHEISYEKRHEWVETILEMLELKPLQKTMVGNIFQGGMSFEQKKRVSIGVELAANPSILFLDEPTTGLDSRAAQIVTRSIRRVCSSGRSVVCTIHQPSVPIFSAFDSLLLLRRGGQTVFFGNLGQDCSNLIDYFMRSESVNPIQPRQNPATWMLEVIGAGTGSASNSTDFHEFYMQSELCEANQLHVEQLSASRDESKESNDVSQKPGAEISRGLSFRFTANKPHEQTYSATYYTQFIFVSKKVFLSYWRSPSYNLVRFFINIIIALIFASAYPLYEVSTDIATVSKSAVIYITVLFCGVVGLQTVMPVAFAERPAFYREQQSDMYSVAIYTLVTTLVEIPYLILSCLCFTLPFFYIVGFQNTGLEAPKFGYYWLFQTLYCTTLIYLGHFFVALLPSSQACDVAAGLSSTILSLFCGFQIKEQDFPTFWLFVYWLNPLHYAIQGLNLSQFHGDTTPITTLTGARTTAERFILSYYSTWQYSELNSCVLALFLFIIALRVGTYFALSNLRHDKR